MSNHSGLADRISRYVRGELSRQEAEEFEELYFQDDELARLVEAEQILQQAPDLLGSRPTRNQLGSHSSFAQAFGSRRYAYAASIMIVAAGAALVWLGGDYRTLRQEHARLRAASPHPTVSDGIVRLSAMRDASDAEPAFTVELPSGADRLITLMLPVPAADAAVAGGAAVRLSKRGGGVVWEQELDDGVLASQFLLVNLPGGVVEPGDYVIALQRHRGAAEAITVAEYAFRAVSK